MAEREKYCHRSLAVDYDEDGNIVMVGATCIRDRCMAWKESDTLAGGYCRDLPK